MGNTQRTRHPGIVPTDAAKPHRPFRVTAGGTEIRITSTPPAPSEKANGTHNGDAAAHSAEPLIGSLNAVGDRGLPVPAHDLDLCFEATFTEPELTNGNKRAVAGPKPATMIGQPIIELPAHEASSVPKIKQSHGAVDLLRRLAAHASSGTFSMVSGRSAEIDLTMAALSIATAGRTTPMVLGDPPSEAERQRMLINRALTYGNRKQRAGAANSIIAEATLYLGLGETRGQGSNSIDMTDNMRLKLQAILSGDDLVLKLEILELVVSSIAIRSHILEREAKATAGVKEEDLEEVLLKTSEIRNLRMLLSQILADKSLTVRLEATKWLLENMGKVHYLKHSLGPIVRSMARKYFDNLAPEAVVKNPELEELHKNLLQLADLFSRKTPPIVMSIDHTETERPALDVEMLEEIREARKRFAKEREMEEVGILVNSARSLLDLEPRSTLEQLKPRENTVQRALRSIRNFVYGLAGRVIEIDYVEMDY